jgi:hypothetical protein
MKNALRISMLLLAMVLLVVSVGGCGRGSATTPDNASTPQAVETKATDPANSRAVETSNSAQERRQLLETVGTLTAAHCYQTYLNIGFIADGKAKGAYTNQDANKVLDSVLSLLNSVDKNLGAVAKIDLDKQDRESLEQMRDLSALLRQQGKELQVYWDSGKEEDATRYDNTRKDSWAAIAKLTGIGR